MSVNLLRGAAAGVTSSELVIRPGKSNAFPMTVGADGTSAGDVVHVYTSLTNQGVNDWEKLFDLTIIAGQSVHNDIPIPYERVRVSADGANAGTVNCNLEPGA